MGLGIIYIIYNVKHEFQAISGNSKIVSKLKLALP
jgi:hypothetical protein